MRKRPKRREICIFYDTLSRHYADSNFGKSLKMFPYVQVMFVQLQNFYLVLYAKILSFFVLDGLLWGVNFRYCPFPHISGEQKDRWLSRFPSVCVFNGFLFVYLFHVMLSCC